jgi:hypothetical protein
MLWSILQASIVFAVIATNIHWQWIEGNQVPALVGVGLAWIVTWLDVRVRDRIGRFR